MPVAKVDGSGGNAGEKTDIRGELHVELKVENLVIVNDCDCK
jgi:hypothetical protein